MTPQDEIVTMPIVSRFRQKIELYVALDAKTGAVKGQYVRYGDFYHMLTGGEPPAKFSHQNMSSNMKFYKRTANGFLRISIPKPAPGELISLASSFVLESYIDQKSAALFATQLHQAVAEEAGLKLTNFPCKITTAAQLVQGQRNVQAGMVDVLALEDETAGITLTMSGKPVDPRILTVDENYYKMAYLGVYHTLAGVRLVEAELIIRRHSLLPLCVWIFEGYSLEGRLNDYNATREKALELLKKQAQKFASESEAALFQTDAKDKARSGNGGKYKRAKIRNRKLPKRLESAPPVPALPEPFYPRCTIMSGEEYATIAHTFSLVDRTTNKKMVGK